MLPRELIGAMCLPTVPPPHSFATSSGRDPPKHVDVILENSLYIFKRIDNLIESLNMNSIDIMVSIGYD